MLSTALVALPFALFLAATTPYVEEELAARTSDALSSTDPLIAAGSFARALQLVDHVPDPKAAPKLLDDVAAKAKDPLTRARATFAKAQRSTRRDDIDESMKLYKALGFIDAVRAVGPFTNTGGAGWGTTKLDEMVAAAAKQDEKVAGLERDVAWQTVPLDPDGELDLNARIAPIRETRAIVAVVVSARASTAAALRLGSSGQVRVALNGVEMAKQDVDRPLAFDQSAVGVQLVRGDNLLLVELGFLHEQGIARLRLTRPDGAPLAGVTTSVEPAAFARALKTKAASGAAPTVAQPALPQAGATLEQLRAGASLESLMKATDDRTRPRAQEAMLNELASTLEKTPGAKSEHASVRARLADVVRGRDATFARVQVERALAADQESLEALLAMAALRDEQDDDFLARSFYARAADLAKGSDLAQRRYLTYARSRGHGGTATDLAILARAKDAPTEDNLSLAADVLEERGDRAGALALAQKAGDGFRALRLQLDIASARLGVANEAERSKLLDERIALTRRMLRARPGSHSHVEQLALALVAAGKKDEARALANARVAEIAERAEPLFLVAKLAVIDADRKTARAALEEAQRLVPQDAELASKLRAIGGDEEELVTRYGLDMDALIAQLKRTGPPPEAVRLGAHVVASTTAIRFFDNGLGRVVTDRVFQVHDAQKAQGLSAFAFPYSEGRERIDVLVAERIMSDGRREPAVRIADQSPSGKEGGVYTDVSQKVVQMGQLRDGDIVHVRTRKVLTGMQNLFGDFFGTVETISGFVPVENFRLVVEAPKGRPLAWGGQNAPAPVVTEQADRKVYDFRVAHAPHIESEPGMPPWMELADFISVSTYGTWDALGAWYERMVAPQLVLDDDLQKVARDAKAAAKGDEATLVRLIYEYVVTSTRYVGIELGIHGWKPYPVSEVHRRRYGDCKDKASLLVALLRAAGVPANITLVRTVNVGHIAPEPASMWTFNHAIAYVPSLDLFLDGTAEQSGWRDTPTMDQGALALIVGAHRNATTDSKASELVTIPVAPAETNLNISDYVLTVRDDGALEVKGTEKFRGSHNSEQRRDFADPATRRARLENHLAQVMPGTQVTKLDVSDLSLNRAEISYTFEAVLPSRASRLADGSYAMALSLYPHDLAGNYAEQSKRKTDIFVEQPWRTRNVMRYVLPKGWSVADLPAGGSVKSDHVSFTQTVTKTQDGFIVDEDTSITQRRIPVAAYAKFRDAALRADALMKRTIRLSATRGGA